MFAGVHPLCVRKDGIVGGAMGGYGYRSPMVLVAPVVLLRCVGIGGDISPSVSVPYGLSVKALRMRLLLWWWWLWCWV